MPIKWSLGKAAQKEGKVELREFVELVAKQLVDHPESLEVTEVDAEHATTFQLKVAPEDRGRVIGRQGRTANAIRILLAAASTRTGGKRALLEIVD